MIDAGTYLTKTASSGDGTSLRVQDASYFYDGYGIDGDPGDLIQIQGQTATARVIDIDYQNNILTLDKALTWDAGKGVSLTLNGTAPDLGAYEYTYQQQQQGLLYGDVSGEGGVTAYDAALAAQYSVDPINHPLTPAQIKAADVTGDGQVSAYDAALIARRAVGFPDKFPVEG